MELWQPVSLLSRYHNGHHARASFLGCPLSRHKIPSDLNYACVEISKFFEKSRGHVLSNSRSFELAAKLLLIEWERTNVIVRTRLTAIYGFPNCRFSLVRYEHFLYRNKINEESCKRADEIYLATIATPITIIQTFTDCEDKFSFTVRPTAVTQS